MFYFQHHVGDYRRDTGHLTLLEHGIYRQLIDLYYITEKPLDASAMRLVCVRTADEEQAYKRVLADFFHEHNGKYFHKRCDFEISRYKDKSSKATDSAKKRWKKIKGLPDAKALPPQMYRDANGMLTKEPINPITKEPNKPIKPIKKTLTTLSGTPDASDELKSQSIEILEYLNANTQRNYRPVDSNLKLITARLKSGATDLQCREVIFNKCEQWGKDPKMSEYLRPATLFNSTKFEQYLGEINAMS